MTCSSWTDARIARLKTLWAEGLSAAAIAGRLRGVSRNAVLGKLHRLHRLGGRVRRGDLGAKPARSPKPRAPRRPPAPRQAVTKTARAARLTASPSALPGAVSRLEQLAPRACHWPVGDPKAEDFAFCGRAAESGPYCAAHAAVARRPRMAKRIRSAGMRRTPAGGA